MQLAVNEANQSWQIEDIALTTNIPILFRRSVESVKANLSGELRAQVCQN